MKIALGALTIALTATLAVLASSSRGHSASGHLAEPVAEMAAESSVTVPPAPLHEDAPVEAPADGPMSEDAPDASEVQAAPLPPPARGAALQELVAQSRQENEQLAELRQQLAAEESRRQDEATQEAEQHAARLEALDTLRQAEASLATGDSDGVDDKLVRAETALSGRTRLDVEAAREALARSDLFPAREYLVAALAENRK